MHRQSSLLLLAALSMLQACIGEKSDEQSPDIITVGDTIPAFTVEVTVPPADSTAKAQDSTYLFSSRRLSGETVLVFFNTSCSDCQRELPRLNQYYLDHCSEPGFHLIAIARQEAAPSIINFWKSKGLSLPYSPQSDRSIYNLFANSTIPRVYFCSPQGLVTRTYTEVLPDNFPTE